MATTGAKYPTISFECKRCGKCCSSAFFALDNVAIGKDIEGIAQWIKWHGCEPMRYPGKDGDVLAIKIHIPCEHLVIDTETKLATCLIYDRRPPLCRNYLCDKSKQLDVVELVKEHGICI